MRRAYVTLAAMRPFSLPTLASLSFIFAACAPPPLDDDDDPIVPGDDFASCIPDAEDGPVFKETLTLSSADGAVLVRIMRRPGEGPTIGETFAFELLGFAMQEGSEMTACVVEPAALSYVYEHHNWDDQAVADDGARTLTLSMTYDPGVASAWTDVLDDSSTDENLALEAVDCLSEGPSPANGCFRRD